MAVNRIDTDTEQAKRKLVKDIAASGRQAIKTKEQTVKPNVDLAAAGTAAATADPVDLGEAELGVASSIVGAPAQDAERYASATKAIFDTKRASHEDTMGTRLGPAHDLMVEAGNFKLEEYDKLLSAETAARAAAAARLRSGSSGDGGGSTPTDPGLVDWEGIYGAFGSEFIGNSLTEGQKSAWDSAWEEAPDLAATWDATADSAFAAGLESNLTFALVRNRLYNELIDAGATPTQATALMDPYIARWEPTYTGWGDYQPDDGLGAGMSGPFVPGSGGSTSGRPGGNTGPTGPN